MHMYVNGINVKKSINDLLMLRLLYCGGINDYTLFFIYLFIYVVLLMRSCRAFDNLVRYGLA